MRGLARRWVLVALCAATVMGATGRAAAAEDRLEPAVKSVYLFKFADYVEWPEGTFKSPDAPFVICVLGRDPLGSSLDEAVRGRSVGGRPIVVRRIDHASLCGDAQGMFVSSVRADRRDEIAAALGSRGVLTVADKGAGAGAIIQFVIEDDKVRFEIDADAARRAGLKLSSRLLSLATSVKRTT
jgi:hypothetical protein